MPVQFISCFYFHFATHEKFTHIKIAGIGAWWSSIIIISEHLL